MASTPITLQHLVLPDPAITLQTALFARLSGDVTQSGEALVFGPGGVAHFDGYMNVVNLGTWRAHAGVQALGLRLAGSGVLHASLRHVAAKGAAPQTLWQGDITLGAAGTDTDLTAHLPDPATGVLSLTLAAAQGARLSLGAFTTPAPSAPAPLRLAISITTFRREADVALTAGRITRWLDGPGAAHLARLGASAHLFVVDNGQSVTLPAHPHLTLIPNANLGGAGGFARGLAAAQDAGFTHCLFMDDDASFQMESLTRTLAFLALARSPRAAVAGAMISAGKPGHMWENGAVFDRFCRPLFGGTDLADPAEVAEMEIEASQPKPKGFYGGWWYFAFPLAAVRHYPFPFFVRGDDISFGLAHRFDTVTLPGVVSFQEDFSSKESPHTLYLDLRNHLHQHLVHEGMEIGALGTARIALWFLARSLVRMHYDSAAAQLMSWEDLMRGPGFFAENADMTAKRPQVAALIRTEAWAPLDDGSPLPPSRSTPPGWLLTQAMKYTFNGHLVPFWGVIGQRRRIAIADRGLIWTLWGLSEAQFVDATAGRGYTVRHDKRRFFALGLRAAGLTWRWIRLYPALKRAHRDSYGQLASRAFWQERFLPATGASPEKAAE